MTRENKCMRRSLTEPERSFIEEQYVVGAYTPEFTSKICYLLT